MMVYALVGESGSGKSYRAMWLAAEYGIQYVIDDGLLISGGRVVAGKSAKAEKTKMGSTKRAIFHDDADAKEMKNALEKYNPKSLLILGTSVRMVNLIAERVGAGMVGEYINIHDIATEEEINIAKTIRDTQGMHVIPVPTMAIKKDFQGYFMKSLQTLLGTSRDKEEKTVMRPTYSYMGDYSVDKSVIVDICSYEVRKVRGIKLQSVKINTSKNKITVQINVVAIGRHNYLKMYIAISDKVSSALDEYVGMIVDSIDVSVEDIKPEGKA